MEWSRWHQNGDDEGDFRAVVMLDDGSRLEVGSDGWVEFIDADSAPYEGVGAKDRQFTETWLHAKPREGRIIIDAVMARGSRITSASLDEMALGRIEQALNAPGLRDIVLVLADPKRKWKGMATPDWLLWRIRHDSGLAAGGEQVREIPPDASLRIVAPESGRFPDTFYERVAEVYSLAGANSSSPALDIANHNGVPVTTVHRWVKEARARGLLAPSARSMQPEEQGERS